MAKNDLVETMRRDIKDRTQWRTKTKKMCEHRLGVRAQSSLYPGSPNFLEPIIDDNVRTAVAQELSVLFSTRQIASFLPLVEESKEYKRQAEVAFDTLIRLMLNFRSKAENNSDLKKERGFSIMKQTENTTAYRRFFGTDATLPDCDVVDSFDFVVPVSTKPLRDAERCMHMHKYTVREFEMHAKKLEWKDADKVVRIAKTMTEGDVGYSDNDDEEEGSQLHLGLETIDNCLEFIHVWEIYHYKNGNKVRTLVAPAVPDVVLQEIDWKWPDKFQTDEAGLPLLDDNDQPVIVEGAERPWPFVQFRNENRSQGFYDSRGDAELLLDNQKAATAYMNAKGIQMDFFAKPIVTGPRNAGSKYRIRPGEFWQEGTEFVQMPRIDGSFDIGADVERAKASRRSGAGQGSFADQRMGGEKTATQVNAEGQSAQRLTNGSVLRDGEPYAELFTLMWEWLQHNPVALPMVDESQNFDGVLSEHILSLPYCIQSAGNSQNSNPDFVLQQYMAIGPMLQGNPYVRQDKFAAMLSDQINPQQTRELVADPSEGGPNGELPIETQVKQNTEMLEQLGQGQQQMMGYLQQMAQIDMQEADEEGGPQNAVA